MITLKQLQSFVKVQETGSFTVAAEELCLTQPTITKTVSNLEELLGVSLFAKQDLQRKRGIQLTDIGKIVYDQAVSVLQQIGYMEQSVKDYQQLSLGTLRLGISPLGGELLALALAEFYQYFPQVNLSLVEQGGEWLKDALLNNDLDVATLMQPVSNDFAYIELCNYPAMVVMNKNQIGKHTQKISLKSLQQAPFILFTANSLFASMIIDNCRNLGFEPNIICKTSQIDLLLTMVNQGMGITLLPLYYTNKFLSDQLVALPLVEPQLDWQMVMAWRKNRQLTPSIRAWLKIIEKQFT